MQIISTATQLMFNHLACSKCEGASFNVSIEFNNEGPLKLDALVCEKCGHVLCINPTTIIRRSDEEEEELSTS
jgi:TPP-dependent indolepyruvate ferredoxin oxidoreductase alpha subunit